MGFGIKRTFSYVVVVFCLCFWSACDVLYGPDYVEVSPEHPIVIVGARQQFKLRAYYRNPYYGEE
jgi:hypothetical protein